MRSTRNSVDVMLIPETSGRKDTNDHSRPEAHIIVLDILPFWTKNWFVLFWFQPLNEADIISKFACVVLISNKYKISKFIFPHHQLRWSSNVCKHECRLRQETENKCWLISFLHFLRYTYLPKSTKTNSCQIEIAPYEGQSQGSWAKPCQAGFELGTPGKRQWEK